MNFKLNEDLKYIIEIIFMFTSLFVWLYFSRGFRFALILTFGIFLFSLFIAILVKFLPEESEKDIENEKEGC
jgi:Ca2+/Na+ antiporter